MTYGRMPLFPPPCGHSNTMHVPLFGDCDCCAPKRECQCVHIRNPACPDEYADVELCVDGDGNLSICVRRPPKPCDLPPGRHGRKYCDHFPWR